MMCPDNCSFFTEAWWIYCILRTIEQKTPADATAQHWAKVSADVSWFSLSFFGGFFCWVISHKGMLIFLFLNNNLKETFTNFLQNNFKVLCVLIFSSLKCNSFDAFILIVDEVKFYLKQGMINFYLLIFVWFMPIKWWNS